MQVNKKILLTLLSGIIDLHFFIATIQIGVIVQLCYTPQARLPSVCNLYISRVCSSQVPRTSVNAEPNRQVIGMCSSHETVQYCQGGCNNSTQ